MNIGIRSDGTADGTINRRCTLGCTRWWSTSSLDFTSMPLEGPAESLVTESTAATLSLRPSRLICQYLAASTHAMRAIETTNGQLTVDLIVKVEGEDKLLTSIFGPHTGVRTDSTEKRPKSCRRFRRTFRETTTLQLQKRQSTAKVQFVTTHLLLPPQSTVDVAKSCSNEEIFPLDLRNSKPSFSNPEPS